MPEGQDRESPSGERGRAATPEPELEPRAECLISALAQHFPNEGIAIADWRRVAVKAATTASRDRFLQIRPESAIAHVAGVVDHFAPHGLTTRQYLQAVLKRPLLLALKPETLVSNVQGVLRHFGAENLPTRTYLRAALQFPNLFYQKPETIVSNIEVVVRNFAADGLTAAQYLSAAAKYPSLFSHRPETITSNIETVVQHFASDGLTTRKYLRAALKHPTLFYQNSETIIANIEHVAIHFAGSGLSSRAYLGAALKQPTLFAHKPQTIIGHINLLAAMHEKKLLPIPPGNDALMEFIVKNPILITFADDNLHLRDIAAHVDGKRTINRRETRQYVEDVVHHALRHGAGDAGSEKVSHARRLLLNALKREGYIKDR